MALSFSAAVASGHPFERLKTVPLESPMPARLLLTGLEARGKDPSGNPAFVTDLLEKRLGRKTEKTA